MKQDSTKLQLFSILQQLIRRVLPVELQHEIDT